MKYLKRFNESINESLTKEEELAILYLRNFRSLNKFRDLGDGRRNRPVSICIAYWNRTGTGGSGYIPVSMNVFNSLKRKKLIYADFDFPHVIIYLLTDKGKNIKLATNKLDKNDPLYNQTNYGYDEWYELKNPKPKVKKYKEKITKAKPLTDKEKEELEKHKNNQTGPYVNPFSFNPNKGNNEIS